MVSKLSSSQRGDLRGITLAGLAGALLLAIPAIAPTPQPRLITSDEGCGVVTYSPMGSPGLIGVDSDCDGDLNSQYLFGTLQQIFFGNPYMDPVSSRLERTYDRLRSD